MCRLLPVGTEDAGTERRNTALYIWLEVTRVNGLVRLPANRSNSTELSDEPTHFMSLNSKQRPGPNSLDLWCDQKPPPFLLLIFLSSKEN